MDERFGNDSDLSRNGEAGETARAASLPLHETGEVKMDEKLKFGNHIVQYSKEYSLCAGCESCAMMCALDHDGVVSHGCGRIQINLGTRSMIHEVLACNHCVDHPCYDKCPKKDSAMCIDESGIVYINEENCIGCGLCIKACRFETPRITMMKNKDRKLWRAKKCDLCRNNEEGPQCILWCPVRCIGLSKDSVEIDGKLVPVQSKGGEVDA